MQKQHSNYLLPRRLKQSLAVTTLVVLVGLLFATSPYGRQLEEQIGLPWLFKLRGEIPASNDVVVVSIDQESARALNLPAKPRKWPRNFHGQLVEKLTAHGATAIGFDIIFDETREAELNQRFANGIRKANNVILFQFIQQKEIFDPKTNKKLPAEHVSLINPIDILANEAQGISPFPLPKVPAQVNHVVLYKAILNDAPTLPVTMLQLHARSMHNELLEIINLYQPELARDLWQSMGRDLTDAKRHKGIQNIVRQFRRLFLSQPQLATQINAYLEQPSRPLTTPQLKKLRALVNIYQAPDSIYLNFYGRFGSIKTIPYHEVLHSDPANPSIDVKGKAIFVGFSEQFQPEQKDGFYTVYTDENSGADVSGVEIIATSFANLLEQQVLKVPSGTLDIGLILLWGILISLILRLTPGLYQIPMTLLLAASYGLLVYYSFATHYYWLPFLIPLLVQLSLASLVCFALQYREVQTERQLIRQAFGYHLPVDVLDKIAEGVNHVTTDGEKVHGIVMATDAQQYTQLSEQLSPSALHDLMNQYYEALFTPIRSHDGIVSDVVGDAAMAIWASSQKQKATTSKHQQACLAALEIQSAVQSFNQTHPNQALPTRIGLDCGEIVMGHVGALDHYEYRAIGDIVNTASRIEGVNKQLGTNIIVSAEVLHGTENLVSRELGRFKLVGKQSATILHDLIASTVSNVPDIYINYINVFKQALERFQLGDFNEALKLFSQINKDGPSQFYINLCNEHIINKPTDFDGSVILVKK